MSTIGSKLETSLAQAAAAAQHIARARDRETAKTEPRRAMQDQIELRASGVESGQAVRNPLQNQAGHKHAPPKGPAIKRAPAKTAPRPPHPPSATPRPADAATKKPRIDLTA